MSEQADSQTKKLMFLVKSFERAPQKTIFEILNDDGFPVGTHADTTELCLFSEYLGDCFSKFRYSSRLKKKLKDIDRKRIVVSIHCCLEALPQLSFKEVANFCNLIDIAEIPSSLWTDRCHKVLSIWIGSSHQKALVMRLLAENNKFKFFSLEKLLREKEMREKFSWIWIDIVLASGYIDIALKQIKSLRGEENSVAFLGRISHLVAIYKSMYGRKKLKEKIFNNFFSVPNNNFKKIKLALWFSFTAKKGKVY